jgi:Na+-transporting methylmalonyl-CoA/oxaloacetate decarboxylase gamma subunit
MWLRAVEFTFLSFGILMVISLLVALMVRIISKLVQREKEQDPDPATQTAPDSCR